MAADEEELSLEETNKIRVSLGLKPLEPSTSSAVGEHAESGPSDAAEAEPDPDAIAHANYETYKQQQRDQQAQEALKQRLQKQRNARLRNQRLVGATLGDADEAVDDTATFLSSWRAKEKAAAEARQRALDDLDASHGTAPSTARGGAAAASKPRKPKAESIPEKGKKKVEKKKGGIGQAVRIGHAVDDFEAGVDTILTLADRSILEEENEEAAGHEVTETLVSVHQVDRDRHQKNRENRSKKPGYTGQEDEEEGLRVVQQGLAGQGPKKMLQKYDEDIDGKDSRDRGFIMQADGTIDARGTARGGLGHSNDEEKQDAMQRPVHDLNYTKANEVRDFMTAEEERDLAATFKKKKKKRKAAETVRARATTSSFKEEAEAVKQENGEANRTGSKEAEEEDEGEGMQIDVKPRAARVHQSDANFVDDEDLFLALSRSRATQLQTQKKPSAAAFDPADENEDPSGPDVVAAQMLLDADGLPSRESATAAKGLEFSEMSEFVRNLSNTGVTVEDAENRRLRRMQQGSSSSAATHPLPISSRANTDIKMEASDAAGPNDSRMDDAEEEQSAPAPNADEANEEAAEAEEEEEESGLPQSSITDDIEINQGIGGFLNKLKSKGLVRRTIASTDVHAADEKVLHRVELLQSRKREEMLAQTQKEKERTKWQAYLSTLSPWEREQEEKRKQRQDKQRDMQKARQQADKMKDYKPDIKLTYTDKQGRALTTKEAYKELSHTFHGRTSGKQKVDKVLRRDAEEKTRLAMPMTDTPLQTVKHLQELQKSTGEAFIRMNVPGARGGVANDHATTATIAAARGADAANGTSIIPTRTGFIVGTTGDMSKKREAETDFVKPAIKLQKH